MECSPSIKDVKPVRLQTASSFSFEVVGMVTTERQIRQLQKKAGILFVLELATSVILGTAFIGKYIEVIRPNTGLIMLSDSGLVAIIYETRRDHIVNISVETRRRKPKTQQMSTHAW